MKLIPVSLGAAVALAVTLSAALTWASTARAAQALAGTPDCRWSQLNANVVWAQTNTSAPGGGAVEGRVAYTRRSNQACQLSGWASTRIINRSGQVLPVTDTKLSPSGSVRSLPVRKPGHGSVVTKLTWLNWCHGKIRGPIMLRITLPHGGGTKLLPINQLGFAGVMSPTCINPTSGSGLQVDRFRKGP